MDIGELLTRMTVWVSTVSYAVGSVLFAVSLGRARWTPATRLVWTAACACLLAHFLFAFHFYHGWSHAAAYSDTARQTEELFGFNWGGGLFINYALLTVWIVDIAWWWRSGLDSYRERPWPVVVAWHGVFIFIIFNATVIFVQGPLRLAGVAISLSLMLTWLYTAKTLARNSQPRNRSTRSHKGTQAEH